MAVEDLRRLMQAYVEKATQDLPSLPIAVLQVISATDKETVNTHEIEEIISTEPAISTKLLRVVNSAYFGMPREIVSINQAIGILGLHQVRNLVLSIGVFNALRGSRNGAEKIHHALWKRAFGTAACVSIIARAKRLSLKDQELLFVGGLLHDIGMLFFLTQFTSVYTQILTKSNSDSIDLVDIENQTLHTDHARLGGMLAEKWNFPAELTRLIESHENPGDPKIDSRPVLLHIADRIVYSFLEVKSTGYQPTLSNEHLQWINFTNAQLDELNVEVNEKINATAQLLGVLA